MSDTDAVASKHQFGRLPVAYVTRLQQSKAFRLSVLLTPLVLAIIGCGVGAFKYSHDANDTGSSPTSSLTSVDAAFKTLKAHYPTHVDTDVAVAWIQRSGASTAPILANDTAALSAAIVDAVHTLPPPPGALLRTQSWFDFSGSALAPLAPRLVSHDGKSVVVAFVVDATAPHGSGFELLDRAEGAVNRVAGGPLGSGFDVKFTSYLLATLETAASTGKGFALANGIGLPFIAVLFYFQVRSVRLLLFPAISTALSLVISWGIGDLAAKSGLPIAVYAPDIGLFLCLALSIDFSFFLLQRFQAERKQGACLFDAVLAATCMSGKTVLVSGSVLTLGWLALLAFPVLGLPAVGAMSAVTVAVCVLVNLTVFPSLALQFPGFFGNTLPSKDKGAVAGDANGSPGAKAQQRTPLLAAPTSETSIRAAANAAAVSSCAGKFTAFITRWPYVGIVPLAVFGLMAVAAAQLGAVQTPIGLGTDLGTGPLATAYDAVTASFDVVDLYTPFRIVLPTRPGEAVFGDAFLSRACAVSSRIAALDGVNAATLQSIGAMPLSPSTCVSATRAQTLLTEAGPYNYTAQQLLPAGVGAAAANASAPSALLTFSTSFFPMAAPSRDLTHRVRDVLADEAPSAQLYHPAVVEVDAQDFALGRLPAVLACALVVVFSLLGCVYRSVWMPLKLVLTIAFPIAAVYGLAVCVYQRGALDFLGWTALQSAAGLSWLLPVATVWLALGLATDYELLFFATVLEQRLNGFSDRDSVVLAAGKVSSLISTAGLIMAFAFLGMLVNTNRFLNEFGFILVTNVLLDTFVVRVCLVPCLCVLGGSINWWPRSVPDPKPTPSSWATNDTTKTKTNTNTNTVGGTQPAP